MKKEIFQSVNLVCMMQQEEEITTNRCFKGVLSRKQQGFRFEETLRGKSCRRNPKLFDGKYLSLVHMQNGKYQCHLKTITVSDAFDGHKLAKGVYDELLNALEIID